MGNAKLAGKIVIPMSMHVDAHSKALPYIEHQTLIHSCSTGLQAQRTAKQSHTPLYQIMHV